MKKFKHNAAIAVAMFFVLSQLNAQIQTPQPSPASTVTQVVGLTDITISYSRPKAKGRAIFGEGDAFLVPFAKLWRTGANRGSTITFSDDIKFAGTDVKAGEYILLTKPGSSDWDIILYDDVSIGGNMSKFNEDNVAASAKVTSSKLSEKVEVFTIGIANIGAENKTAHLQLSWENTAVNIPIEVDYHDRVMASIEENTKVNPGNYTTAANYYLSVNKDLEQALAWMNEYLSIEKNKKQFWHIHTKAKILAALGNKKEAKMVAKESMELAKVNPGGDFGYIKNNEELLKSL